MITATLETFDCITYKQRVQREIHEQIKHLSPQEQVQWFRNNVQQGPFATWWQSIPSQTGETLLSKSHTSDE